MKTQQEFIDKACELVKNKEALDFIRVHNAFVHRVDDVVDEEMIPLDKVASFRLVWDYYNHPYYLRHAGGGLAMLSLINHIFYQVSVLWEHSGEPAKVSAAATLRHTSISMLFAVIALECGSEVANATAAEFMEHTLLAHVEDIEFKVPDYATNQ